MPTTTANSVLLKAIPTYLRSRKLADGTRSLYDYDIRAFAAWCGQTGADPVNFTEDDMAHYVAHLEATLTNASTIHNRFRSIRIYYAWLQKRGTVNLNPFADFEWRIPETNLTTALTLDELRAVWAACRNDRDRAVIGILALCGAQSEELCAMNVEDLSVSDGYHLIRVPQRSRLHDVPYLTIPHELWPSVATLVDGRESGPLVRRNDGERVDRRTLVRWTQRVGVLAGVSTPSSARALTYSMRAAAMHLGIGFATLVRTAGEADPRRMNRWTTLAPVRVTDHPSLRIVREVVSDGKRPEDHLARAHLMLQGTATPPAVAAAYGAAALEQHLRDVSLAHGFSKDVRKSQLASYTGFLKGIGVLSQPDLLAALSLMVTRDNGAHGWFDDVTAAEAAHVLKVSADLIRAYPVPEE